LSQGGIATDGHVHFFFISRDTLSNGIAEASRAFIFFVSSFYEGYYGSIHGSWVPLLSSRDAVSKVMRVEGNIHEVDFLS